MTLAALVLTGGLSSRMGQPKAWLPIGKETMLTRIVRLLGEVASPVLVVRSAQQELPSLPDSIPIIEDELPQRGPLAGIAAGLRALTAHAVEACYVTSCDAPLLQADFVRTLHALLGEHAACVPYLSGHAQPLAGVYRLSLLSIIDELLATSTAGPSALLAQVPTRLVLAEELRTADPELDSLRNVNTPEEYAELRRRLS